MSYDLYLHSRPDNPPLSREEFFEHLTGDHFEHTGDTVNYSNKDTGVYFHFDWSAGGPADANKDDQSASPPHLYFNINFFRPHTFGLEAAEVLPGLVEALDLIVSDPQSEGMGEGEFSVEGFLRGWNAGNRFAARAMRSVQARGETVIGGHLSLPAAVNRAYWSWNYNKASLCDELGDIELIGVYVPPIWFCREGDQVKSFALWPNLVPTAVPKVDYVLVLRNELAGRYAEHSNETPGWLAWEGLVAATSEFPVRTDRTDPEHPYLILFSEEYDCMEHPPERLAEWVIGLPDWPGKPESVAPDQILDTELLQG